MEFLNSEKKYSPLDVFNTTTDALWAFPVKGYNFPNPIKSPKVISDIRRSEAYLQE